MSSARRLRRLEASVRVPESLRLLSYLGRSDAPLGPVVKRARSAVIADVDMAQSSEPRGIVEDFL